MGLHSNTKRITRMFCYAMLGITLFVLVLRLTVFRDMAVTGVVDKPGGSSNQPGSGGDGEISGSGDFPYTFNSKIYFPSVDEAGNVLIENPESNTYLLSVDIVDNGTGKSIYYTGAVEPGDNIEADMLSLDGQKLENGVYECTANVAALSPDNYSTVQSQEMPVSIYIGEKP